MEFHEIMEDLMIEKDLSLSELARQMNMDYKQLSNYAKGVFSPSLKSALRLADFFDCSLDYLAGLSDNKKQSDFKEPDFLFYQRYENILKESKISHYRLTKNTGINVNDSRLWKKGSIPTFFNLIKIADYLGVSIDYLIGRSDIK